VNVEKTDDPILLNRYIPTDDRIYLYPDDRRVSVHVEKSDDRILLYQIVPPTDDRIYLYRDDRTIEYCYIRSSLPQTIEYTYIGTTCCVYTRPPATTIRCEKPARPPRRSDMRISGRPGRRRPNIAISDRTIEYTYIGTTCCDTRPPATTITPPPSGAKNPPARQDDRIYVYQDAPAEDVPILLYQNARQNEPARPPPVGALFSLSNFLIQRQRRCFLTKGVLHARARRRRPNICGAIFEGTP